MAKISLDEDRDKRIEESYYYRGKLISAFSYLEKAIERYIAIYFIGPDRKSMQPGSHYEFMSIVLERMTFEAKRTSMRAIVDAKSKKSGFKKTKNNSFPHSKLFEEIRLLNDQRNYFAHYGDLTFTTIIDNTIVIKDDYVIGLHERRDRTQTRKYTLKQFNDLIDRIKKVTAQVKEMSGETTN